MVSYQDIGHHLGHGCRLEVLLLVDAPPFLHARTEEVLQPVRVMHGFTRAHCDRLLNGVLQVKFAHCQSTLILYYIYT